MSAYIVIVAKVKNPRVFENNGYKTVLFKMSTRWKGTNNEATWTNFSVRFTGPRAENLINMVAEGQTIQVSGKIIGTRIWGDRRDQVDITVSGTDWDFVPGTQNGSAEAASTQPVGEYDETELTV